MILCGQKRSGVNRLSEAPFLIALLMMGVLQSGYGFQPSYRRYFPAPVDTLWTTSQRLLPKGKKQPPTTTIRYSQRPNNGNEGGSDDILYSRDVRLREEAESPFRRVRFFLYTVLGGGALTSLLLSLARIAAASSGINSDLMNESLVNAGVDVAGLAVLAVLFQQDLQAQESRLKRATKGATFAKLAIRVHKGIADPLLWEENNTKSGTDSNASSTNVYTSLTLADLRRNRGIEKRVVIAAAGNGKIEKVLEEARSCGDALEANDLVIVPVILPAATAPTVDTEKSNNNPLPRCVALPVGTAAWRSVLEDETKEARKQGVDIEAEGICIILKKNGRVGQRTRGIFLQRMVGEVQDRKQRGMDVTNI